jgi:hypothetical protein
VFDGAALQNGHVVELFGLFAYNPAFTGGVYIGAGTTIPRPAKVDRLFHVFVVCAATTRFAVVGADGDFVRGSAGTTASRLTTSTYVVSFDIDVTTCSWQVTVGQTGSVGATTGEGNVAGRSGNANGLFITTSDIITPGRNLIQRPAPRSSWEEGGRAGLCHSDQWSSWRHHPRAAELTAPILVAPAAASVDRFPSLGV